MHGPTRRSRTSRCTGTTPAHAAVGSRSNTSGSLGTPCSFATASSATIARRPQARLSILLHGSYATIENCLFVGNVANLGVDVVGLLGGAEYHAEHGSGALTVFENSRATVGRSTFTGNWNGVDDNGTGSMYVDTIFWRNTLKGGISPASRYELDIADGAGVRGSFIHGDVNDLRDSIDRKLNTFNGPDPRSDAQFAPQAPQYAAVGYRPGPRITNR